MEPSDGIPRSQQALSLLRPLYLQYGYRPFKMSRFEAYDFYAENRPFLASGQVLAFTDGDGRLMALKPDVTLSIVKHARSGTEKVFYHEAVYRPAPGGHTFQEIMQTGLECIGPAGLYAASEVVLLAAKSLQAIQGQFLLDLSHMGLVSGLLAEAQVSGPQREALLGCIRAKNAHELRARCASAAVSPDLTRHLAALTGLYGPFETSLAAARALCVNAATHAALDDLERIFAVLAAEGFGPHVNLDFSAANDLHYYNGLIFQGFVQGLSRGILSGGQYDPLLRRLGKEGGAVGFALCLDLLDQLEDGAAAYDADVLLLYPESAEPEQLSRCVAQLIAQGLRVRAQCQDSGALTCRRRMRFEEGRLTELGVD